MPNLILTPSAQAVLRKLAGFHSGNPLKIVFRPGETIDAILDRFNEYRSPENQIEVLFTDSGLKTKCSMSVAITSDLVLYVP